MATEKKTEFPAASTRWGIARDLPRVLEIERETFGGWDEAEFRKRLRDRKVIIFVAETAWNGVGERPNPGIRGFVVYELSDTEYGARYMMVINMAAVDPVARRAILDKLECKSVRNDRTITWSEE